MHNSNMYKHNELNSGLNNTENNTKKRKTIESEAQKNVIKWFICFDYVALVHDIITKMLEITLSFYTRIQNQSWIDALYPKGTSYISIFQFCFLLNFWTWKNMNKMMTTLFRTKRRKLYSIKCYLWRCSIGDRRQL